MRAVKGSLGHSLVEKCKEFERPRWTHAVEDHSAPIPEERTSKLGGIIDWVMCNKLTQFGVTPPLSHLNIASSWIHETTRLPIAAPPWSSSLWLQSRRSHYCYPAQSEES